MTAFQLLIAILKHAGDWQQALVIYEVMHARVLPLTICGHAGLLALTMYRVILLQRRFLSDVRLFIFTRRRHRYGPI